MRQNQFVYIGQMGAFWRLNDKQWREVLEAGASGEGYDLDAMLIRRLKQKPSWARKSDTTGGHYSVRGDIRYFEPLDWYPEDFKDQLKEEGWV